MAFDVDGTVVVSAWFLLASLVASMVLMTLEGFMSSRRHAFILLALYVVSLIVAVVGTFA